MKFLNKAVYLEEEKILVISDLHLGYEASLNVALPTTQYKTTTMELENIFNRVEVKEIIILGDLKQEFARSSMKDWGEIKSFLEFLLKKVAKVIIIKGNHDNYLENIASQLGIRVLNFYVKEDAGFIHGDKQVKEIEARDVKKIFMGHLHPAISIVQGVKKEVYKCFLKGRWKGKEIIIIPSFLPLTEGQDINIEETNLAYDFDLDNFEVYLIGDKVYDFGKLKKTGFLAH